MPDDVSEMAVLALSHRGHFLDVRCLRYAGVVRRDVIRDILSSTRVPT